MFLRTAALAIAITLTAASLETFSAQAGDLDQKSVRVDYSDLNLLSSTGHASLVARLNAAADQACGPVGGHELQNLQSFRACRQTALDSAMPAAHAAFAAAQANSKMVSESTQEPAGRNVGK
jgi:UrcA family protein